MNEPERYCDSCGAPLGLGVRFCENCGVEVAPPLTPQAIAPPPAFPPQPVQLPPPSYAPTAPVQPTAPQAIPSDPLRAHVQSPAAAPAQKKSPLPCVLIVAGLGVLLVVACLAVSAAGYFGYLGSYWPGPTAGNRVPSLGPSPDQPGAVAASQPTPTFLPTLIPTAASQAASAVPPTPLPATAAPTLPAAPSSLQTMEYAGVVITYDTTLASDIEPAVLDASSGPSPMPAHRQYTLTGYPLQDSHHQPQIFVFPAQDYADLDANFQNTLHLLKGMIDGKMIYNLPDPLPFFPAWPAGEQVQASLKYLDFRSGTGMRYLTQYGQDIYPINNQDLFYTFQGLSQDGQWMVSAVLPVSNPVLPDPATVSQDQAFMDNYQAYTWKTASLLESQPDASFTPSLVELDALMQTILLK